MLPTHLLSVRSQPSCHTVGTLLEAPPGRILLSRTSPLQPRSQLHFCNYLFGYLIDIWPLSLDYKFQILITVSVPHLAWVVVQSLSLSSGTLLSPNIEYLNITHLILKILRGEKSSGNVLYPIPNTPMGGSMKNEHH